MLTSKTPAVAATPPAATAALEVLRPGAAGLPLRKFRFAFAGFDFLVSLDFVAGLDFRDALMLMIVPQIGSCSRQMQ
jgi:hypothetical protein